MLDNIDNLPLLAVFDLDDTLWRGEVDCTGGPPFIPHKNSRHTVYCRSKRPVTLFHDVPKIFDQLISAGVNVAYASRTWEPLWAQEALKKFRCGPEETVNMWSCSVAQGWGDCSKTKHMSEISRATNLPYPSMVFFDNEMRNIREVELLGPTIGYCPNGMTNELLLNTLQRYSDKIRTDS